MNDSSHPNARDGKTSVGILLFDDVEVLDFAGPYEVFSRTRTVSGAESRRSSESAPFSVFTVARNRSPVRATGGLTVVPDYSFEDAPVIDLLVVPGGFGTRPLLEDEGVLTWIAERSAQARWTASVCTGSLLLAKSGLLDGLSATTHWAALDLFESLTETVEVVRGVRWVDEFERGSIITSAGVAAGIDMAFHVVATLCGEDVARETARYIDYPLRLDSGR